MKTARQLRHDLGALARVAILAQDALDEWRYSNTDADTRAAMSKLADALRANGALWLSAATPEEVMPLTAQPVATSPRSEQHGPGASNPPAATPPLEAPESLLMRVIHAEVDAQEAAAPPREEGMTDGEPWEPFTRRLLHALRHIRLMECERDHDEHDEPCPVRTAKEAVDNRPCSLCGTDGYDDAAPPVAAAPPESPPARRDIGTASHPPTECRLCHDAPTVLVGYCPKHASAAEPLTTPVAAAETVTEHRGHHTTCPACVPEPPTCRTCRGKGELPGCPSDCSCDVLCDVLRRECRVPRPCPDCTPVHSVHGTAAVVDLADTIHCGGDACHWHETRTCECECEGCRVLDTLKSANRPEPMPAKDPK